MCVSGVIRNKLHEGLTYNETDGYMNKVDNKGNKLNQKKHVAETISVKIQ